MNEVTKIEEGAVQVPEATNLIQVIERVAMNPDVDVDKMERLLAMQERILAKQAEAEFNMAMSDAQGEMHAVAADAQNTQTKSKYATYATLDRALRPIYTKHGLSLSFDTAEGAPADYVRLLCHVGHRGGHTRVYRADLPADGKGAKGGDVMTKTHATGSAFTYGQRYLLKLIFNIAIGDDDDGNAAGTVKITAEQKAALIEKMQHSGVDPQRVTERLLRAMGVPYLDDLPAGKYDSAMAMLDKVKPKEPADG